MPTLAGKPDERSDYAIPGLDLPDPNWQIGKEDYRNQARMTYRSRRPRLKTQIRWFKRMIVSI